MSEQAKPFHQAESILGSTSPADHGCMAPGEQPHVQSLPGPEAAERAVGAQAAGLPAGLVNLETSPVRPQKLEFRGSSLPSILRGLSRAKRLNRMRRTVLAFARCASQGLADGGTRNHLVMVTLTYRNADGWEPKHISKYVQRATEWLERRAHSYAYAWVIEMQKRGAPHYHVLFWLPEGVHLPKPDWLYRTMRTRMWPHGSSRIENARAPSYITKYASKGEEEPLPFGARLFGIGACERRWRRVARWSALPAWLKDLSQEGDVLSRIAHVGWVNRQTGDIHESEWRWRFYRDEAEWVVCFERKGNSTGATQEDRS